MVLQYTPTTRLDGKVTIVTGGSSGIGKVTVRRFAELGAHIFVLSRNKTKTLPVLESIKNETGNNKIEYIEVDFSSLAQVKAAAEEFLARNLPLHILVCNAGSGGNSGVTEDGFEFSFGTNYLSHFLLTQLLLEKLKQSAPSRIVNVSSRASLRVNMDYELITKASPASGLNMNYYGYSKLAQVLSTRKLAQNLEGTGVTAYSLHPGIVITDVWRRVPYLIRIAMYYYFWMISEEEGALTTLYCSVDPKLENESGYYYDACKIATPNPAVEDQKEVDKLWDFSLDAVKSFL